MLSGILAKSKSITQKVLRMTSADWPWVCNGEAEAVVRHPDAQLGLLCPSPVRAHLLAEAARAPRVQARLCSVPVQHSAQGRALCWPLSPVHSRERNWREMGLCTNGTGFWVFFN